MTSSALRIDQVGIEDDAEELAPGTKLLMGQFTIESFLNSGGFGIVYLARDSLDRRVVIKECYPSSFCRRVGVLVGPAARARQDEFRSTVRLFVQEAFKLSRLNHPGIVRVRQVFEDNDTAYMAMDHVSGPDLLQTLEGTAPALGPAEIIDLLYKLLDAVGYAHDQGLLHRDISPDNILLDPATKQPILIDFGASRKEATRKTRVLSGLRIVKDGYSPHEFYVSGSKQSPCSDLYALGATFYHLISREVPRTSQERLSAIAGNDADPVRPLAGRFKGYPAEFLRAIDMAMAIFPRDRLQSVDAWRAMLASTLPVPKPAVLHDAVATSVQPQEKAAVAAQSLVEVPPAYDLPVQAPVDSARLVATPHPRGPRELLLSSAAAVLLLSGLLSLPSDLLHPGRASGTETPVISSITDTAASPEFLVDRVLFLPFVASADNSAEVASLLSGAPDWLVPGQRIVEVNGNPVQDNVGFNALLVVDDRLHDRSEAKVILGFQSGDNAEITRHILTLPVERSVTLVNGLTFRIRANRTGFETVVAVVPNANETDLLVGDVLLTHSQSGQRLDSEGALEKLLQVERIAGKTTYGFMIRRGETPMSATFQLGPVG